MNSNSHLRWGFVVASLWCAVAVGLGAIGAHGLQSMVENWPDPEEAVKALKNWDTASRYQLFHGIAAVISSFGGIYAASTAIANRWFGIATILFLVGTAIFSGCLYAMVLGGPKILGAIVPLGGLSMIVGWICLAWAGFKAFQVTG